MSQKRKVEVTVIDENDTELYSIFRNTANNLTQLFSQSLTYQKFAFDAGQRHALEKLKEWIAVQQQEGKVVTVADISAYLQGELNNNVPILSEPYPCDASQNRSMELGMTSSAPIMQNPDADGGNTFGSQDLEMEINE